MNFERVHLPMHILLVEDNPDDVDLLRTALKECRGEHQLHVVTNGEEAMAYLRQENSYHTAWRPDLILLDLNLPRKDGREVLAEVKADEALKSIPVLVLTSSTAPGDVATAYRLQANCYISKPIDFNEYLRITKGIEDFWFGIAKLPGSL
jgi:two-component system response regulator